jgi:hypothetical protein
MEGTYYMKKLFEIYTESGKLDIESINKFIEETKKLKGFNFDQIARYIYQDENGRNTLVECDIPTNEVEDNFIFISAYEYDGKFEDYSADREVMCEQFNGDWNSLESFMRDMAEME